MRPLLFLLFLAAGSFSQITLAQNSKIGNAQITFEFVSKGVQGTISGFESESKIDWENIEHSIIVGSVKSKTLDTNNGLRNWSLRSGKYFDATDYPEISFRSDGIIQVGNDIEVSGQLIIKDTTKPIIILFNRNGNKLSGTFSIYSSDYGIKIKKQREDNLVKVNLVLELNG